MNKPFFTHDDEGSTQVECPECGHSQWVDKLLLSDANAKVAPLQARADALVEGSAALVAEVSALREALEFYAEPMNWLPQLLENGMEVTGRGCDEGEIARAALANKGEGK
jgi:hypothetical protein